MLGQSDRTLPCKPCPVCINGSGQITGPASLAYEHGSDDPFNRVVRFCDECEGTGVVTAVREAGIIASSMQRVLPIVDRVMGEWRDERAALATWEWEGGR